MLISAIEDSLALKIVTIKTTLKCFDDFLRRAIAPQRL